MLIIRPYLSSHNKAIIKVESSISNTKLFLSEKLPVRSSYHQGCIMRKQKLLLMPCSFWVLILALMSSTSSASWNAAALAIPSPGLPTKDLWVNYKTLLNKSPILTKATTAMVISCLSDTIVQHAPVRANQKTTESHDWSRTVQVGITGFCYSGPMAHFWYQTVERLAVFPPRQWPGVLNRIALDMVLFSPLTIAGYFTVRTLLESKGDISKVKPKLRAVYRKTLTGAWKFRPFFQLINFSVIPLQFRTNFAQLMALLWTGFLTYTNNSRKRIPHEERQQ